jgi:hypothetical protein
MTHDDFIRDVFQPQVNKCLRVLDKKRKYRDTTDDRLCQFKQAATMSGIDPKQALMGMMAKHSVQLATMIASKNTIDLRVWDEVITDHLNYLFLLKGLVMEVQK